MHPLISIIIPTFNSASFLQETLESIATQTYSNWECIVVDDGSTDDTAIITARYQEKDTRFRGYRRPVNLNKGPSSARNYGLTKAKGECVIFLDSDDLLAVTCLENRMLKYSQNPNCDFLVFQMQRFLEQPDFLAATTVAEQDINRIVQSFIHLHGQWTITSPIYRTTFFKNIGFNSELVVFEDLEVAIKAIMKATAFKIFETVDCYYRNDEHYSTRCNSITVKIKMVKGFQVLIGTIANLTKSNATTHFKNSAVQTYLVESYKNFFRYTILENSKAFKKDNK